MVCHHSNLAVRYKEMLLIPISLDTFGYFLYKVPLPNIISTHWVIIQWALSNVKVAQRRCERNICIRLPEKWCKPLIYFAWLYDLANSRILCVLLLPGTWSHLWFAGVPECPPWCSIVGATVTVHQFFCILHIYATRDRSLSRKGYPNPQLYIRRMKYISWPKLFLLFDILWEYTLYWYWVIRVCNSLIINVNSFIGSISIYHVNQYYYR